MRWWWVWLACACAYDPQRTTGPTPSDEADASTVTPDAKAFLDAPLAPAVRCQMKYGGLQDFELCSATETECTFYVRAAGDSCNMECGSVQGTCIRSHDNSCANPSGNFNCDQDFQDQICVCAP